jgi:hypothetical protein
LGNLKANSLGLCLSDPVLKMCRARGVPAASAILQNDRLFVWFAYYKTSKIMDPVASGHRNALGLNRSSLHPIRNLVPRKPGMADLARSATIPNSVGRNKQFNQTADLNPLSDRAAFCTRTADAIIRHVSSVSVQSTPE